METASPMMGVNQRAMNIQMDTVSARQLNMQNEGLGSGTEQIPLLMQVLCWVLALTNDRSEPEGDEHPEGYSQRHDACPAALPDTCG